MDKLLKCASIHAIRPQLAGFLSFCTLNADTNTLIKGFDNYCHENLLFQIGNAAEFVRLNEVFHHNGIEAVPFKGFWLSHLAYGDIGAREAGDIDIYIQADKLVLAEQVMILEGYSPEPFFRGLTAKQVLTKYHEYNFEKYVHGSKRYHIELHWGIGSPALGLNVTYNDLSSQVVNTSFQGKNIKVFTPAANLLLAILHHGGKDPLKCLKHINDIARLSAMMTDPDWQWIISTARIYGAERIVFTAVRLSSILTGTEIPAPLKPFTSSTLIRKLTEGRIRAIEKTVTNCSLSGDGINDWLYRLRSRRGLSRKLTMINHVAGAYLKAKIAG
jgi:hypothetical protein